MLTRLDLLLVFLLLAVNLTAIFFGNSIFMSKSGLGIWELRYWVSQCMKGLMDMDKKFARIRCPWIVGTAALTKAQVLEINMFNTCSGPPSRRNDTPGTRETLKLVWE